MKRDTTDSAEETSAPTKETVRPLDRGLRLYRQTYKAKDGTRGVVATWYVAMSWRGSTLRFAAFTDVQASTDLARAVLRLARAKEANVSPDKGSAEWIDAMPARVREYLAQHGVISTERAALAEPLTSYVDRYEQALTSEGRDPKHISTTVQRVRRTLATCQTWTDVTFGTVEDALAAIKAESDLSDKTRGYYVNALKMFCNWAVRRGYIPVSPLERMKIGDAANETVRRAFTGTEAAYLLAHLRDQGGTATDRAMLYEVAMTTGLRRGELDALTVANFDLESDPIVFTIAGSQTKNGEDAELPIDNPQTVARLRDYFGRKMKAAKAFKVPNDHSAARVLRADLAAARTAWLGEARDDEDRKHREGSDFLRDVDGAGRVLTFHSFRHTFGTWLARSGAPDREVRYRMRLESPQLLERYTRNAFGIKQAREPFPTLEAPARGKAAQRATGTTGKAGNPDAVATPADRATCTDRYASHYASRGGIGRTPADNGGRENDPARGAESLSGTETEATFGGIISGTRPSVGIGRRSGFKIRR